MPTITRFEDISAWQTSRKLANVIYDLSGQGPFERDFGMKDQIRRAAVSVMSNIAEGFESQTQRLFITFLGRAKASAGEVRSQLYIALDRGYISQEQFSAACDLADKSSRQLYRFISYLETTPNVRRVRDDQIEYRV